MGNAPPILFSSRPKQNLGLTDYQTTYIDTRVICLYFNLSIDNNFLYTYCGRLFEKNTINSCWHGSKV